MFEWLFLWLAFLFPTTTPPADYVGAVAVEVAYIGLQTDDGGKPKVPTADCTTCNGTGRVRTGDNQGWTKCPDCLGLPEENR